MANTAPNSVALASHWGALEAANLCALRGAYYARAYLAGFAATIRAAERDPISGAESGALAAAALCAAAGLDTA